MLPLTLAGTSRGDAGHEAIADGGGLLALSQVAFLPRLIGRPRCAGRFSAETRQRAMENVPHRPAAKGAGPLAWPRAGNEVAQ